MGIRVEGLDDIQNLYLQIESEGSRRVVKEMIAGGNLIADVAREMAPVDYGNLEQAIKVAVSPVRDARGRFATREVSVYIDMDMRVPQFKNKRVGDYAYEVHEHVTPYGPKQLGERSLLKQGTTNEIVGGGFLERAVEKVQKKVLDNIERAVDSFL